MAARKKTQPQVEENLISKEEAQQQAEGAYEKGKLDGQQDVYKVMADFLSSRMLNHFQLKNDELAKELREIYSLIKSNIK
tara:strand:- start:85 stop:324 length:240 start_codon:yes stop_codon:yes gene_type:complete